MEICPREEQPRRSIHDICWRLDEVYGRKRWQPQHQPLDELVLTILSQHTSDTNAERAFRELRQRYPDWDAVRAAPTETVADAMRIAGLADRKAPRIQAVLDRVLSAQSRALESLAKMPLAEAKRWLMDLPGVGSKTAACVLLFAYGRPALPVDTHVHRVSRRLGLIESDITPEQAHDRLEHLLAPNDVYGFHVNMIAHGRRVCRARSPRCGDCALMLLCQFARAQSINREDCAQDGVVDRGVTMGTEIILVRHGQTASNVLGVLHGYTDVPLNEAGIRQANRVAEQLALLGGIGHLYSSPLRRAQITAEAIGRRLRIAPRLRADLAEINFGDVEGYTLSDLERKFPELHARILDFEDHEVAFPNGESRRDFHQRVWRVFDDLVNAHRGERLVVVSHGGVIGSGIAQLTNGDPNDWERFMVKNCSITHLDVSDSREVLLRCWDDVAHLDERGEVS